VDSRTAGAHRRECGEEHEDVDHPGPGAVPGCTEGHAGEEEGGDSGSCPALRTGLARRIHERIAESRAQQDNEQWHLLIIDELIDQHGIGEGRLRFFWLPQVIALVYYQMSWLTFVVRPPWSYRLNADFEDHAEHEYASFVAEHPEWEIIEFVSQFTADYGQDACLADVFRQIGHDERVHKQESEAQLARARFH